MRVGQARKRDAAEKPIRKALEAVGADVTPVSGEGAPDLVVRFRGACKHCRRNAWGLEVKSRQGKRTEAQEDTQWPIVRTEDEALAAIGAIR